MLKFPYEKDFTFVFGLNLQKEMLFLSLFKIIAQNVSEML